VALVRHHTTATCLRGLHKPQATAHFLLKIDIVSNDDVEASLTAVWLLF